MYISFIYIAVLLLQIFTYLYIRKLNTCGCTQSLNVTTQSNIQYLEYIFLFFILISIINILYIFNMKSPSYLFINYAIIYTLVLLFVHILLILHTYRLYKNMPNDCECALKWPRYYLYLTALLALLNVVGFVIGFIYGFSKTLSKSSKK